MIDIGDKNNKCTKIDTTPKNGTAQDTIHINRQQIGKQMHLKVNKDRKWSKRESNFQMERSH